MNRIPLPSVVIACLVSILPAQDVVPASMLGVEGGSGTNVPFGTNLACRYQCVYEVGELPWSGPRPISGIRIRPDFNNGASTAAKGFLDLSVLVSTTSRTASTISSTFDDNYGTDATWVIRHRILQLPAQPQTTSAPRPANIDLPFDDLWVYGTTPYLTSLPAPDNLLVEIWIHSQPVGSYRVDNMSGCLAQTATFGNVGPACYAVNGPNNPNNLPVELTGNLSMVAGANYSWQIDYGPASMPFLLALSLSNQGGLGGNPAWPLPYPMFDPSDPTQPSAAIASLGHPAPDCWFNVSPMAQLGGLTDATGHGAVSAQIPAGTQFVGSTYYSQAIVLAPTANPLFLISSLGRETTVCGPFGVATLYQFYNANQTPPPPLPSSGSVSVGSGLVIEVY